MAVQSPEGRDPLEVVGVGLGDGASEWLGIALGSVGDAEGVSVWLGDIDAAGESEDPACGPGDAATEQLARFTPSNMAAINSPTFAYPRWSSEAPDAAFMSVSLNVALVVTPIYVGDRTA
jgi:hypothetical protein